MNRGGRRREKNIEKRGEEEGKNGRCWKGRLRGEKEVLLGKGKERGVRKGEVSEKRGDRGELRGVDELVSGRKGKKGRKRRYIKKGKRKKG